MSTKNFNGFEDFGRRAPRMVRTESGELGAELTGLVTVAITEKALDVSPVGPDEEAARRVAAHSGKPAYGHMRDRYFLFSSAGGGAVPASQVRSLTKRLKPGQGVQLKNDAAHFNVVNRGRKRLKTGRLAGSVQARRGISKPTVEHANAMAEGLKAEAIRRQEAKP